MYTYDLRSLWYIIYIALLLVLRLMSTHRKLNECIMGNLILSQNFYLDVVEIW